MTDKINEIEWLHILRKAEIETIIKLFPADKALKILEIGGGDGFQAKCVSESGYEVISIDVNPRFPNYYQVHKTNVSELDFQSESFDLIFSSHVLPHIQNLDKAFTEMKRVLKNEGTMIHIVPTTWWSTVTNFWHYVLMPKNLWSIAKTRKKTSLTNTDKTKNNTVKKYGKLINYLFLHPLGENPSFIHEFFYFSDRCWQELFKKNGFSVLQKGNCPYLYSGYGIFKMRFLDLRKTLAKYSITSSHYYIMKKHSIQL